MNIENIRSIDSIGSISPSSSSKFICYDEKIKFYNSGIATNYFKNFIDEQINILKELNENYTVYYDILITINPYEYLKPLSYTFFINKNVNIKHIFDGTSIRTYLKNKEYKSILYYEPLDVITLYLWELYQEYKFISINKTKSIKTLSISNWNFASELFYLVRQKYGFNISDQNDIILLSYLNKNSDYQKNMIKVLSKFINNKVVEDYDKLNYYKIVKLDSYDTVYCNIDIRDSKFGYWEYYSSKHEKVIYLLISMLKLNKKGKLIFVIGNILNDIDIDIIEYIHNSFNNYKIIRPSIQIAEKQGGFYIIASEMKKDKKNIIDILHEIYKDDKSFGSLWKPPSINENNFPKNLNSILYKKNRNKNFKYWRLCERDEEIRKEIIKKVNLLNENYYIEGLLYLNKIKEKLHNSNKDQITTNTQMYYSIGWAKQYDWKLKLNLDPDNFLKDYNTRLLQDMFAIDEGIKFEFKKYDNNIVNVNITKLESFKILDQLERDMYLSAKVIDTRDPKKYRNITQITKLYQKSLGSYIKHNFNISYNNINVSRAWTKMYEILTILPEILPDKNIKSFHLCEAPGGFILAMEHYLKTKRNAELEWFAESLNPKHPDNIKKYGKNIFSDSFGIMKKNPDKWIWGQDNTGDITNPANIKSYSKYCENVDIITSDCGLQHSIRNKEMNKINYSQFLFIFNNLPKNSNCIVKIFAPLNIQKISLIYLVYNRFRKVFFYKPMQNPGSAEFYMIGIDYENPFDETDLKKLFNFLEHYDEEQSMVKEIPKPFLLQLEKIMEVIAKNYDDYIAKKIYYVDNLSIMTPEYISKMGDTIIRKNEQWTNQVGLMK